MTLIQKIRTSFSTQLSLWVAGFVLVISGVVIFLLIRFSEDVIRDESIDTTMLALENTALHIDNTLRQTEMTALPIKPNKYNSRIITIFAIIFNKFCEILKPTQR